MKNLRVNRTTACGFTLLELLVVIAIIALLAGLLMPAIVRSKRKAQNVVCLNDLHQLGIATRIFTEEHDNRLPRAELLPTLPVDPAQPLPRISDVLKSYVGGASGTNSSGVFHCPEDRDGYFQKEGSSYQWNTGLNGRAMDETRQSDLQIDTVISVNNQPPQTSHETRQLHWPPETTPLFFDYDDFHLRASQPSKNSVFMDGHTAPLTYENLGVGS